ncbi:MAG TPA: hypothetical protein P5119_00055 [Candidatus Aminicenantes bacterium]|nr:hypothetical protein [Candidatus Aminicenantes bacterium]HRY63716.1 hypothetical protein [Candidatus Aminicenantes bacterium]HRZ73252.1 hypothetical protein [Candidatus Aminicenantes bacterium]
MVFTIVTVLVAAAAFLGLAGHRFLTTREEARSTILYGERAKKFFAWLALRTIQISRRASPRTWAAYLKGLPLWRQPVLEKWLFIGFYGSFLYLAASGFFFGLFVPRGLFGFPLVGHVACGGLFAVCLTVIVLFKGRDFLAMPRPAGLSLSLIDPRKMAITAARVKRWAFWVFASAGFLLTVTALVPMLPWFGTPGQKILFELHRYSAVASAAAALVFAGLEIFERPAPARSPD